MNWPKILQPQRKQSFNTERRRDLDWFSTLRGPLHFTSLFPAVLNSTFQAYTSVGFGLRGVWSSYFMPPICRACSKSRHWEFSTPIIGTSSRSRFGISSGDLAPSQKLNTMKWSRMRHCQQSVFSSKVVVAKVFNMKRLKYFYLTFQFVVVLYILKFLSNLKWQYFQVHDFCVFLKKTRALNV